MSETITSNALKSGPFRPLARTRDSLTAAPASTCILAAMLFFLPSFSGLLYWPTPDMAQVLLTTRFHSVPVLLCEALFIVSTGRSSLHLAMALPRWTKCAALVWGATVAASFAAMEHHALGTIKTIGWIIHALFAVQVVAHLRARPQDGRLLIAAMIGGGLLYVLPLAARVASISEPAFWLWRDLMPGFLNVRQMAYYYAALAVIAVWPLLTSEPARHRALFAAALMFVTVIAWSGSRASLLAIVLVWAAAPLLVRQAHNMRFVLTCAGLVVAGILLAQLHHVPDNDFDLLRLEKYAGQEPINAYSSGRLALWSETIARIQDRPFFGYGAGQSVHVLQSLGGVFGQPHNAILQFLLEWGVIGGVAGLVLILFPLWRAPARYQDFDAFGLAALGGLVTLFIAGLLDAALYHPWSIVLYITLGAVAYRPPEARFSPSP